MKIIILEDEIPAYQKLISLIQATIQEAQIIGWARSVAEAKLIFENSVNPDLIISDIELLDGKSFEVFQAIEVDCPIIFSTAFDQYLLDAFQANGIAYLLKPYDQKTFVEAINKYQKLYSVGEKTPIDKNVIDELKKLIEQETKKYKTRFSIKKKTGIKVLKAEEIICFEAQGDFCIAYDRHLNKHVVNFNLGEIEAKIDPKQYFRVNRSEIVNIVYIEKIEAYHKNRLAIKLLNKREISITSSVKTPAFRQWLED